MKAITNFTIELERVKIQESLKPKSFSQGSLETPMLTAKIDTLNQIMNDLAERHQVGRCE